MSNPLLIVVLIQFLVISILIWFLVHPPKTSMSQSIIQELKEQLQEKEKQVNSLLNRLQAPDVRTFQALQNYLINPQVESVPYVPKDDVSESRQLHELGHPGYDDTDDEEIKDYFLEPFGISVDRGSDDKS